MPKGSGGVRRVVRRWRGRTGVLEGEGHTLTRFLGDGTGNADNASSARPLRGGEPGPADPLLLLDVVQGEYGASDGPRAFWVPHHGLESLLICKQGKVELRHSLSADSGAETLLAGGLAYVRAGSGVSVSEVRSSPACLPPRPEPRLRPTRLPTTTAVEPGR